MQEQAGQVHIFRRGCGMKTRQNQAQSPGVFRLDTRFAAGKEEAFQPLVLEALDHEPDRNLSGYRVQVESIASSTGTDGRSLVRRVHLDREHIHRVARIGTKPRGVLLRFLAITN